MILNYIKLSLRLMARGPFITFINLLGLSVGFAAYFVLSQYSLHELTSDRYHPDWQRIYRFGWTGKWTDDKVNWLKSNFGTNDASFAADVATQYPDIVNLTRILPLKNITSRSYIQKHGPEVYFSATSYDGTQSKFIEPKLIYADPNFFSFFNVPLIYGDLQSALSAPGSVILSETTSKKYFGDAIPLGKEMSLNDSIPITVTGVFRDLPTNTHLDFQVILSSLFIQQAYEQTTNAFGPICYFKLVEGCNAHELTRRLNHDLRGRVKEVTFGNYAYGDSEAFLQPLSEVAFDSYRFDGHVAKSKIVSLILLYASVAILILAWINYINLTIAKLRKRAGELGVRKIVGARGFDLYTQLFVETFVVCVISMLLSLTLIQLVKNPMQVLFGIYVSHWVDIPIVTWIIFVFTFATGAVTTAFLTSSVSQTRSPYRLFMIRNPNSIEKKIINGLTATQYAMAITLIVLVFTVSNQIDFVLNRDVGFKKDETLIVDLPDINRSETFQSTLDVFTSELEKHFDVTVSQSVPGDNSQQFLNLYTSDERTGLKVQCNGGVDENFLKFYNIDLVGGRNFHPGNKSDNSSILLSEASVHRLGYRSPEEAIGQKFYTGIRAKSFVTCIGVFKDYRLRPFLNEAYVNYGGNPGLILTFKNSPSPIEPFTQPHRISIRIDSKNFNSSIAQIEAQYTKYFPSQIFNWYFLDDIMSAKYQGQIIARNQVALFSLLAIGIACLGFLGMITNKILEKTKEIGIRKVLGARLIHICQVLLKTTVRHIIIASIIAFPVAYLLSKRYLENFSERVDLQWWHYAFPVAILVFTLFASISSVVLKAARSNPVEALKYE